jgi:hypothetical protein
MFLQELVQKLACRLLDPVEVTFGHGVITARNLPKRQPAHKTGPDPR